MSSLFLVSPQAEHIEPSQFFIPLLLDAARPRGESSGLSAVGSSNRRGYS